MLPHQINHRSILASKKYSTTKTLVFQPHTLSPFCISYPRVIRMKKSNWKPYVIFILIAEAVGALSGFLSMEGSQSFSETVLQPPLSPPAIVFPIVWTLLYGLMGISAARVWLTEPGKDRSQGLNLWIAQLAVNFFWSLIFFNDQAYGFALLWLLLLWVLVLLMILKFWKTDKPAALLQLPYLLWLTFAAYLNAGVWYLNG